MYYLYTELSRAHQADLQREAAEIRQARQAWATRPGLMARLLRHLQHERTGDHATLDVETEAATRHEPVPVALREAREIVQHACGEVAR